jgi:Toprim-like
VAGVTAERMLERLGLGERIVGWRAGKLLVRCPLPRHEDRRASAAIFESGVLACARCGRFSPFDWLLACGLSPAETVELLVELGLRAERSGRRAADPAALLKTRRAESRSPGLRGPAATDSLSVSPPARGLALELAGDVLERLAGAVFERRRLDGRLGELRGFAPSVLDLAGVGVGRPTGYGFAGPRAALDELRLLVPSRDEAGRTVGLLAIAPNPTKRREPKLLALAGRPRTLLELVEVDVPLAPVLLVCEGELDALAAASAGIAAVGVPGVGGFERHAARIAALVRERSLERALLVPDADAAGRSSFRELAAAIAAAGALATFADVLEHGADVGSELVRLAGELERVRPELDAVGRRREAGRALLALTGAAVLA